MVISLVVRFEIEVTGYIAFELRIDFIAIGVGLRTVGLVMVFGVIFRFWIFLFDLPVRYSSSPVWATLRLKFLQYYPDEGTYTANCWLFLVYRLFLSRCRGLLGCWVVGIATARWWIFQPLPGNCLKQWVFSNPFLPHVKKNFLCGFQYVHYQNPLSSHRKHAVIMLSTLIVSFNLMICWSWVLLGWGCVLVRQASYPFVVFCQL